MPPPAKDFLTPEQVGKLQQALKKSDQPHVRGKRSGGAEKMQNTRMLNQTIKQ
jgi:hypothetical protein